MKYDFEADKDMVALFMEFENTVGLHATRVVSSCYESMTDQCPAPEFIFWLADTLMEGRHAK